MPTVPFSNRRVEQAPITYAKSTARATAADYGSETASAIGQLGQTGQQVAELQNQKNKEQEQTHTMEAFNQYKVESGKAEIAFRSLEGMDVTEEARAKYLQEVDTSAARYRESLPNERAKMLYDQEIDRDGVAKKLDAEAHVTRQGANAAEAARQSTYTLSMNSAAANWGTKEAAVDLRRALETSRAKPGVTKEESRLNDVVAISGFTKDVVGRRIQAGNLDDAQKTFDDLKATGMVSADAVTSMTADLERAGRSAKDAGYVRGALGEISKTTPVNDMVDINTSERAFYTQLQKDLDTGVIKQDEFDRRRQRGEGAFVDMHRDLQVRQSFQRKQWDERIQGAGGLEAANAVIADAAAKPETAWLVDELEQRAFTLYGTEAQKKVREEMLAVKNPVARFKGGAAIMDGIQAKSFATELDMVTAACTLKLPQSDINKLSEAWKSQGTINGLGLSDVKGALSFFLEDVQEEYKKHPEDVYALWRTISDGADPKKKYNETDLNKLIGQYRWKGIIGKNATTVTLPDGRVVPATLASAIQSGQSAGFRPDFTAEVSREKIRAEMQANGINPNPRGPDTPARRRENTILEKDNHQLFGTPLPDVMVPAKPGDPLEENVDDNERAYIMSRYLGKDVGFDRITDQQNRRKAADANFADLIGKSAQAYKAEAAASAYLGKASYGPAGSGIHGVEAAQLELADSLKTSKVPNWIENYWQETRSTSLRAAFHGPEGDLGEDAKKKARIAAQAAFLETMNELSNQTP